jgi:hypothetical protein
MIDRAEVWTVCTGMVEPHTNVERHPVGSRKPCERVRTTRNAFTERVMQLQQQYLAVQAKLDRAYDDPLAGRITDELWLRKSAEWEAELGSIRRETARHERAGSEYAATGSQRN